MLNPETARGIVRNYQWPEGVKTPRLFIVGQLGDFICELRSNETRVHVHGVTTELAVELAIEAYLAEHDHMTPKQGRWLAN